MLGSSPKLFDEQIIFPLAVSRLLLLLAVLISINRNFFCREEYLDYEPYLLIQRGTICDLSVYEKL